MLLYNDFILKYKDKKDIIKKEYEDSNINIEEHIVEAQSRRINFRYTLESISDIPNVNGDMYFITPPSGLISV